MCYNGSVYLILMPKKISLALLVGFFLLFGTIFSFPQAASAQVAGTGYRTLEKIPFLSNSTGDMSAYFKGAYNLFLIIIVLSAIFMIVIGGFVYLTSGGNTAQLSSAKGIVFNAIIGLILALISWLILNIINPELVNVSVTGFSPVTTSPSGGGSGSGVGGGGGAGVNSGYFAAKQYGNTAVYTDASARTKLQQNSVSVTSSGNCSNPQNPSCTSLDGFPVSTVAFLIQLKRDCGCSLTVTGGTETGHATHGPGKAAVDIDRSAVLAFMQTQTKIGMSRNRPIYSYRGYRIWDEDSGHFHAWEPATP